LTSHPVGTPQYCALPVSMEHQLQSRDRQNQKAGAGKRARSLVPSFLTAMGLSGLFERERCTLALPIEWEVGCKKCACIKRWRLTTFDDRRNDVGRNAGQGGKLCQPRPASTMLLRQFCNGFFGTD